MLHHICIQLVHHPSLPHQGELVVLPYYTRCTTPANRLAMSSNGDSELTGDIAGKTSADAPEIGNEQCIARSGSVATTEVRTGRWFATATQLCQPLFLFAMYRSSIPAPVGGTTRRSSDVVSPTTVCFSTRFQPPLNSTSAYPVVLVPRQSFQDDSADVERREFHKKTVEMEVQCLSTLNINKPVTRPLLSPPDHTHNPNKNE